MLNLVYEHVVTQVQTIVMHTHCSSNSPPLPTANVSTAAASHCHCSPADEERMFTFICPKKDAAADGANFRLVVWNTLVTEMAKYHETGAPKTSIHGYVQFYRVQTPQSSLIQFSSASDCLQHCHDSERIIWF